MEEAGEVGAGQADKILLLFLRFSTLLYFYNYLTFLKYIWQPWMMVRNTASVVKGEEDFVSLHISNLPECFPNRGNSDENIHWVKGLRQDISGVVSILISHCPTWRAGSCKQMLSRRQLRHPETQQFLVGILNFLY